MREKRKRTTKKKRKKTKIYLKKQQLPIMISMRVLVAFNKIFKEKHSLKCRKLKKLEVIVIQ